jgi:teichuronic acid biosynthesis glycosyltransferase TuaG
MPLVSVIMPAFNAERFIRESIESALAQTLGDIEVLVADDASTDRTRAIVEELVRRDSRVRLLSAERNSGPAAARNRAIEAAGGRYVSFLDSDDRWLPHKLERQIAAMGAMNWAFSFGGYEVIGEDGAVRGRVGVPELVTYHQLLKNNLVGCLTAVYDSAIVGKVFAPLVGREDLGLWLLVLRQVDHGHGINEVLAQYRVHPRSVSARKRRIARQNWQLYRQEGFGVLRTLWYFGGYAVMGTLKTYFPKTACKLGFLTTPPSTPRV